MRRKGRLRRPFLLEPPVPQHASTQNGVWVLGGQGLALSEGEGDARNPAIPHPVRAAKPPSGAGAPSASLQGHLPTCACGTVQADRR